jgi:translation initiation factor IF-2
MTKQKPKKLFKVASEFNVATQSIVDTLGEHGFDVANRPNSNITRRCMMCWMVYMEMIKRRAENTKSQRRVRKSRRSQIMIKPERKCYDRQLSGTD